MVNTFDFEFSSATAYGRAHRLVSVIDQELAATTHHYRKLQLRLELAEARLEEFCYQKMRVKRDGNYHQAYQQPKQLLTTACTKAKQALNKYELEHQ